MTELLVSTHAIAEATGRLPSSVRSLAADLGIDLEGNEIMDTARAEDALRLLRGSSSPVAEAIRRRIRSAG